MAKDHITTEPIAIVGLACRLPGAPSVDDYWRVIRDGICTAQPLPPARFDRSLYFDPRRGVRNKSYSDLACLVDYHPFDNTRLRAPAAVAECPDVAYTTLLEVAAQAMLDAGQTPVRARDRQAGVYIGHTRSSGFAADLAYGVHVSEATALLKTLPDFERLAMGRGQEVIERLLSEVRANLPRRSVDGRPALGANVAAMMIARTFGLSGPSMAFNSACASSLQALAQAVRALQLGRVEMAVAAGASYCHCDTLVMFSQAQSLSATGSRPFDADADGLIVGEGYVALVLKTLSRALQDKDRIHAVVRGVGMSSDGHGKSLWAPQKRGQVQAVRRAYEQGLNLSSLGYIEAHATSTQVGDATELAALGEALAGQLHPNQRIALGSVKANIGHTLECAGLSSLLKTVLCLKHATLPPAINITTLNPKVAWDTLPFDVPRVATSWPEPANGIARRAAVNAFGIGGLNVHVVVDEAPRVTRPVPVVAQPIDPPRCEIAIIGRGAVLPGARTAAAFIDLVRSGRDPKIDCPEDRWSAATFSGRTPSCLGGFINDFSYDWKRHKIPPKQLAQASPMQFMILDSVDQALAQAGYQAQAFNRERTGVVVGNAFGGEFAYQLFLGLRIPEVQAKLKQILAGYGIHDKAAVVRLCESYAEALLAKMPALLDETGSFTSSSLASRITKSFDLLGGAVAVDAGMVSAGAALTCCIEQLLAGDNELMICVASHEDLSPSRFESWQLSGLMSAGAPVAPHAKSASGCVPAEGCVVLLLKRLADAQRDGDAVLGIVRGVGTATADDLAAASRLAASRALFKAGIHPRDVANIETSAFGEPRRDADEHAGLSAAYQSQRVSPMPLTSVVAQVGHTGAASGAVALLKLLEAVESMTLPATFAQPPGESYASTQVLVPVEAAIPLHSTTASGRVFGAVHNTTFRESAYHILIERGLPVPANHTQNGSASAAAHVTAIETIDGVPHFDATQRRKQRLREQAAASPVAAPAVSKPAPAVTPPPPAVVVAPIAVASPPVPAPVASPARPDFDVAQFLVNFVVEQTGYPPEIVELDADLEADLGIDSIKKAQLFGELRDHFDIVYDGTLTLDDFPTLRHIADYLSTKPAASTVPVLTPTLVVTAPAPVSPLIVESAPVPSETAKATIDVSQFLVNFVVEQTGYPPEIVELDADLEADLGIDSIKKAQLFGELREHFEIVYDGTLTLDDFPTLRHIADYLSTKPPVVSSSSTLPPASPTPEPSVPTPSLPPAPVTEAIRAVTVINSAPVIDVQLFLVNFVVEQTGYPPEIVELDADLEADLGIDSIKKAQLFGELREHFEIVYDGTLTLDDFPTLRHIADYLEGKSLVAR